MNICKDLHWSEIAEGGSLLGVAMSISFEDSSSSSIRLLLQLCYVGLGCLGESFVADPDVRRYVLPRSWVRSSSCLFHDIFVGTTHCRSPRKVGPRRRVDGAVVEFHSRKDRVDHGLLRWRIIDQKSCSSFNNSVRVRAAARRGACGRRRCDLLCSQTSVKSETRPREYVVGDVKKTEPEHTREVRVNIATRSAFNARATTSAMR